MILTLLQRMIRWYYRKQRKEQEKRRKEALIQFIHETLPEKAPEFLDQLIIQDGTFNYFVLPSETLPAFDFVLPSIPMFVKLLTPENSEWEIAVQYGVDRKSWEAAMEERAALREGVFEIPISERPVSPLFWELDWNLATDQSSLFNDFRTKVRISK